MREASGVRIALGCGAALEGRATRKRVSGSAAMATTSRPSTSVDCAATPGVGQFPSSRSCTPPAHQHASMPAMLQRRVSCVPPGPDFPSPARPAAARRPRAATLGTRSHARAGSPRSPSGPAGLFAERAQRADERAGAQGEVPRRMDYPPGGFPIGWVAHPKGCPGFPIGWVPTGCLDLERPQAPWHRVR